jgi:Peptide methionine sulfoxide reductase
MKATYRDVCSHKTGHAKAVQIEFDANEVSYEDVVNVFWSIHNPTTKIDRVGIRLSISFLNCISYFWCYLWIKVTMRHHELLVPIFVAQ